MESEILQETSFITNHSKDERLFASLKLFFRTKGYVFLPLLFLSKKEKKTHFTVLSHYQAICLASYLPLFILYLYTLHLKFYLFLKLASYLPCLYLPLFISYFYTPHLKVLMYKREITIIIRLIRMKSRNFD